MSVTYGPDTTAKLIGVEHGNTAGEQAARPSIERTERARTEGNATWGRAVTRLTSRTNPRLSA